MGMGVGSKDGFLIMQRITELVRVLHEEMHGCATRSTRPVVGNILSDVISLKS